GEHCRHDATINAAEWSWRLRCARCMDEHIAGTLPVFVFPGSIDVIFTQPHTHKQLVTLYNPYEFPISYRVLCTAPKKYSVIEPRGTLKAKCCVDM
uniref:MSP domain-containing protein n=1 Tax=Parascaris univalens TaxID=6257 RepID=A0A914ZIA4_PARUN